MIRRLLALVAVLVGRVPPSWARPLCSAAAAVAAWALPGRVEIARRNLAAAWPEGPPIEPRAVFEHLAWTAWTFVRLPVDGAAGFPSLRARRLDVLRAAVAQQRGVVVVSGHLGAWERVAAALAHRLDVRVHLVVKPLGALTGWVELHRRRAGLSVIRAGRGVATVRRIVEALDAGEVVVMAVDQHAPRSACVVPFFGRPAATESLPARLAITRGGPLLWVTGVRRQDGRDDVEIAEIPVAGLSPDDVEPVTAHVTQRVEAAIRAAPAQWPWTHRRWKVASDQYASGRSGGRRIPTAASSLARTARKKR